MARFQAVWVDSGRAWAIHDDQVYDDRFIVFGVEKERAEFGALLLNEGGIPVPDDFSDLRYEVETAIEPILCEVCQKHFMLAQTHNGRCPADQQ